MAYSIRYDTVPVREEAALLRQNRRRIIAVLAVPAFVLALALIPGAAAWVQQLLFPGSDASTMEALEALAVSIGEGEPIGEAIHGFCQEVISGWQ